jgi:hypothetical protein
MAAFSGVVTLSGSAQNLATALGIGAENPQRAYTVGWLSLQADTANANPVFIGTLDTVATTYAFRIETPTATIPDAPLIIEDAKMLGLRLSDLYVLGTNTQKLRVLWLTA